MLSGVGLRVAGYRTAHREEATVKQTIDLHESAVLPIGEMNTKYKETWEGGLAVSVVLC